MAPQESTERTGVYNESITWRHLSTLLDALSTAGPPASQRRGCMCDPLADLSSIELSFNITSCASLHPEKDGLSQQADATLSCCFWALEQESKNGVHTLVTAANLPVEDDLEYFEGGDLNTYGLLGGVDKSKSYPIL